MAFQVGDRIGDYEVAEILGAGGMGQVYKVRNVISNRVEAMKVLLPNLESDPSLAERFIQEIQVQASMDHPNIAALHTAQRVGNQLVMVMEFVQGTTIDTLLKQGPLEVAKALDYTIQVLSALAYAHARGIIHRDIKPSNMMLMPSGTVKLMDFGIAKMADRQLTRTGHTVGSLFYMSPEQINNPQVLDARSDLYSLGVSLYEMVTGRKPFQGDSDYSIMLGHLARPADPPIQVDARVPQELSDVILMAISKDPDKRFQSAEAFKRALESIQAELAPAGQPLSAAAMNTVPMPGPAMAISAQPQNAPVQAAAARRSSGRGVYIALGSVATVVVLALAAWQVPKLMHSSAAEPRPGAQTVPVESTPAQEVVPTPAPESQPASGQLPAASDPGASPAASTQAGKPAVHSVPKIPDRGNKGMAQVPEAAHSEPAAQTPPSPPQPVAQPAAQSASPAPDMAALREVRKQLMSLGVRAKTLTGTIDQLKAEQARMGLGLRGDVVNAQHRMELALDEAEASMRAGDVEDARKNLGDAEKEIDKLEKFLGR